MGTLHEHLSAAARERGISAAVSAADLAGCAGAAEGLLERAFSPAARERVVRHTRVIRGDDKEIMATEEAVRSDFVEHAEELSAFVLAIARVVDSLVQRGNIAIRRDGAAIRIERPEAFVQDSGRRER